jgi:hypothetical protein
MAGKGIPLDSILILFFIVAGVGALVAIVYFGVMNPFVKSAGKSSDGHLGFKGCQSCPHEQK